MSVDSFYFKGNKNGYAFFFKQFNPNDAHRWFEILIALIDRDVEAKAEVKTVDISAAFGVLMLDAEHSDFAYSYGRAVQKLRRPGDAEREEERQV